MTMGTLGIPPGLTESGVALAIIYVLVRIVQGLVKAVGMAKARANGNPGPQIPGCPAAFRAEKSVAELRESAVPRRECGLARDKICADIGHVKEGVDRMEKAQERQEELITDMLLEVRKINGSARG